MPDDDSELIDFNEEEEGSSINVLDLVWHWAPVALFGVSLVYMLITIILNPLQRRIQRKPPLDYYQPAVKILNKLNKNENSYSNSQKIVELTTARVNFNRLAKHYRKTSDFQNGKYSNPYLLLAETNKRLAEISIPARRKSLYSDALTNFSLAYDLEQKDRSGEDQKSWDRQFFLQSKDSILDTVKPEVINIRKVRRLRYIIYNLGLINLSLERTIAASGLFSQLKDDFFKEEMENLRLERTGMQRSYLSSQVLPASYELLPGDKVKLHYFLAHIAYLNKDLEKAEKEYKVFLLKVGRSRERFIAKMRLGEFAFKRGRKYILESENVADKRRIELKKRAIFEFKNSADIYSEIVEESAPEDLLREAYFKGGIANLEYAAAMDVGRETSWDYLDREFEVFKSQLESFSGMKLPERSLNLPEMLARSITADSLSIPGVSSDVPSLVAGSLLSVITEKRITPIEERDMRLAKARSYFDAASSGTNGRYLAESRVLIGRSLIVEESSDKARRILKHAMEAYPYPHIKTAALLGIGWTYLIEGSLDEAWKTYRKLPSAEKLPDSSLYTAKDIIRNITDLARKYVRRADSLSYPENWLDSSPGSEMMVRAIENSRELHRSLLQAASAYDLLLKKYKSKDISVKVNTAGIYSRLAELLLKRPFGSAKDKIKARQYKINAADAYMKIAEDHPASLYDKNALLSAGQLFYDSGAYERCCESFELFNSRYGLSDQIGRVRNLLGLSYQKLGLFEKSEEILRTNAQNSTTAEGRKSLYYLGQTYLLRSEFELDKKHLGGPESELLLAKRDDKSVIVSALFYLRDITDWNKFLARIKADSSSYSATPGKRIKELFTPELSSFITELDPRDNIREDIKKWLLKELNSLLTRKDLYSEAAWRGVPLTDEVVELLRRDSSDMGPSETMRLNRLLLDAAFSGYIVPTKMRNKMDIIPRTAREVFEYVRRQPGLGPSSLPWRWSTFALGEALFRIAQEEKFKIRNELDKTKAAVEKNTLQTSDDIIRNNYQRAMDILVEGLNRYVLFPQHPDGLKVQDDPKGYMEIKKSRFKSLYYLGLCYKEMKNSRALQRSFSKMIDIDIYDPELWQDNKYLSRIYKNAYFYLGQSYYESGRYEEAYDVYEAANDKLKATASPYFIYMMGESLLAMGKKRQARSKYIQARHAVRSFSKAEGSEQDKLLGVEYWQQLNEQRIEDLEYLEKVKGENG